MTFPEPLASLMKDRIGHPLVTHFGITNFGVNLAYLPLGMCAGSKAGSDNAHQLSQ